MGNTRPVRTNTVNRAANMSTTQGYVRILVCAVCFQWNIHTNPVHLSESYLVSAVFFWIGTKIQKKKYSKKIEEKIIIFDDQFFRIIYLYLMRSVQKCHCSLLCVNAHYFLSQINAKFYSVCINLYTWQKSTCRNNWVIVQNHLCSGDQGEWPPLGFCSSAFWKIENFPHKNGVWQVDCVIFNLNLQRLVQEFIFNFWGLRHCYVWSEVAI